MAARPRSVLHEALAKARIRIEELRGRGDRVSEQDTKAILIDPVLAALGWHLDELDEVRREYRATGQDNPVDYALLDFGQPRLFVEAKALGVTLDRKCASQVLGYAAVAGVGWCLLTNGDEYRLYNSHAKVDVDEKLFRSVRLSDPEQTAACLETLTLVARDAMRDTSLDVLWKSQFVDRRVKATLELLFGDDDGGLARLVHKHSSELGLGEVRESLRRAHVQVAFPAMALPVCAGSKQASCLDVDPPKTDSQKTARSYPVQLSDLIEVGLVQPPLALEKTYRGVTLGAVIEAGGGVRFAEEIYDSLSTAGGMARKSVVGAPEGHEYPHTNGWTFWLYRDAESAQLRPVDALRQRYLRAGI